MRMRLSATLVGMMLLAIPGFAQDAGSGPPPTLVVVTDITEGGADPAVSEIIVTRTEQILAILDIPLAGPVQVQEEPASTVTGEDLPDPRVERELASLEVQDVQLVIFCFYQQRGTALTIEFTLFDPVNQSPVGGVLTRARTGLTLFTSVNEAVSELEPALRDYLDNRYVYLPPVGKVERININGPQEDVQVFFASRDIGKIEGGSLFVPYTPFNVGSKVLLEMGRERMHSRKMVVELPSNQVELDLPVLWPKNRYALSAYWTLGMTKGAGMAFRLYLEPDQTFLELANYRNFDRPANQATGTSEVWQYDYRMVLGQYLIFPYDSPLRFSVNLGFGQFLTSVEGFPGDDFSDTYITIAPTVELNQPKWRLYAAVDAQYALGFGNNLLGRNFVLSSAGLPPVTLGVSTQW